MNYTDKSKQCHEINLSTFWCNYVYSISSSLKVSANKLDRTVYPILTESKARTFHCTVHILLFLAIVRKVGHLVRPLPLLFSTQLEGGYHSN